MKVFKTIVIKVNEKKQQWRGVKAGGDIAGRDNAGLRWKQTLIILGVIGFVVFAFCAAYGINPFAFSGFGVEGQSNPTVPK